MEQLTRCPLQSRIVIIILSSILVFHAHGKNVCDQFNGHDEDDTFKFTNPDMGDLEFGTITQYKDMSCCAEGYLMMTWYKGSDPYPWKGVDQAETFMDNGNQTLVFRYLMTRDEASYTCSASNGTSTISHTKELQAKPMQFTEKPHQLNSTRCRNYTRLHGSNVTFYCEFFFGHGGDEDKMIFWYKHNQTSNYFIEDLDNRTYSTRQRGRDDNETIGIYLYIQDIRASTYATYVVKAVNAHGSIDIPLVLSYGDPNPGPSTAESTTLLIIIIVLSSIVIMALILSALGMTFKLDIKLIYKYNFGKVEKNDDKKYDVFISHSGTDQDFRFVKYVIMRYLEGKCGFKLCVEQRDFLAGTAIADSVVESIEASQSWIIVLTPDYLKEHWSSFQFNVALEHSLKLHSNLVIIIAKELPANADIDHMKALKHIIRVTNCLKWQPDNLKKTAKFWKTLLLQLPRSPSGRSHALKAISDQSKTLQSEELERQNLIDWQISSSGESGYCGSPTSDLVDGPGLDNGGVTTRSGTAVSADSALETDFVAVSLDDETKRENIKAQVHHEHVPNIAI